MISQAKVDVWCRRPLAIYAAFSVAVVSSLRHQVELRSVCNGDLCAIGPCRNGMLCEFVYPCWSFVRSDRKGSAEFRWSAVVRKSGPEFSRMLGFKRHPRLASDVSSPALEEGGSMLSSVSGLQVGSQA